MDKNYGAGVRKLVAALIRSQCCNYDCGNCLRLEDEDGVCACLQIPANHLECNFFEKIILPLNKELEAEIVPEQKVMTAMNKKNCARCGKMFYSRSNSAKYCSDACRTQARRDLERKSKQQRRARSRGSVRK